MNVIVYNEFLHEREDENVRKIYPKGIHTAIKDAIEDENTNVSCITLDNVGELDEKLLDATDVLIWWGHMGHDRVPDSVAEAVVRAVNKGMGAIFLHSGHESKPFKLLMGTPCSLTWREDGDRELVWVCDPTHPIAEGLGRFINIEHEETYGEPFDVPTPDELVFISSFSGGEVFRSGCCYKRGYGKIFYFRPGHESFSIYYHPDVIRVIKNALDWARPQKRRSDLGSPGVNPPFAD